MRCVASTELDLALDVLDHCHHGIVALDGMIQPSPSALLGQIALPLRLMHLRVEVG
jgi:hypothetical protein